MPDNNLHSNQIFNAFLICLSLCFLVPELSFACTTILIGKDLTSDRSVIHAHNEDMGNEAVGRLWYVSSKQFPAGTTIRVPYVTIPQPSRTYAYWASGNARDSRGFQIANESRAYDNILVGMNERGVTMSCNWMYSKEDERAEQGIRRYALRQLILERSSTAREAVDLIASMIETYGQADWGGLTFCLADPEEAWVVETTSTQWVARRVRDNEIWVIANQFTLEEDFDLSSPNLVQFAEDQGWYRPEEGRFNFRKVYCQPERLDETYDTNREDRVRGLLVDVMGTITPENMFSVLRDRYNKTDLYQAPTDYEPTREVCNTLNTPRPICTNLCQSSFVAHLRSDLPVEIGALIWYTMATPMFSGYFPIYAGSRTISRHYRYDSAWRSDASAWWSFRSLQQVGDQNYIKYYPLIKETWSDFHLDMFQKAQVIEGKANELIRSGEVEQAKSMLNRLTLEGANRALDITRDLLKTDTQ